MNVNLTLDCLACLDEEQAYLNRLCEKLHAVRKSLLSEAFTSVDTMLAEIPISPPDVLRKRYAQVAKRLADHFELPAKQITLDHLANYVRQHSEKNVGQAVRDIRRLRRQSAMLNRSNLAIAGVLSRVVDRFVRHVTGVDSNPTYSRTGTVEMNQPTYRIQRSA